MQGTEIGKSKLEIGNGTGRASVAEVAGEEVGELTAETQSSQRRRRMESRGAPTPGCFRQRVWNRLKIKELSLWRVQMSLQEYEKKELECSGELQGTENGKGKVENCEEVAMASGKR